MGWSCGRLFGGGASGLVAQWLEQSTHNRLVVGSIPTGPTARVASQRGLFLCRYGAQYPSDAEDQPPIDPHRPRNKEGEP